ncbi:hypothetical protein ACLB2K_008909 [Fragaria x ananassa]
MTAGRDLCNVFVTGVFSLLLACRFISGVESDVNCLKSIRAALEDPLDMLSSSWDFSNDTEGFICNFLGVECWHPHESKVLNIKIGDLGLKGQFPRGVANCPIPRKISNCSFLNFLKLDDNKLRGKIPPELDQLSRLKTFSVVSNQLSGPIPNFDNGSRGVESYANNPGLCGFPLKSCRASSENKWSKDLVTVIKSHAEVMLGALGFGIGFVFSFSFFVFR